MSLSATPSENRYEIYDGQLAGFSDYKLTGTTIAFTRTEVDPAVARPGMAKQLVTDELADSRRRRLAVLPFCRWVRKVIARNAAAYLDLVPQRTASASDSPRRSPADHTAQPCSLPRQQGSTMDTR